MGSPGRRDMVHLLSVTEIEFPTGTFVLHSCFRVLQYPFQHMLASACFLMPQVSVLLSIWKTSLAYVAMLCELLKVEIGSSCTFCTELGH